MWWFDIIFLLGFLAGQPAMRTRNLPKIAEEFLFLAFLFLQQFYCPALTYPALLPPSSWQKASRVLFYHFSLGSCCALPGTGSLARHFSLHWSYRREKQPLTTAAIPTATTYVLNHDRTTSYVHVTGGGHSGRRKSNCAMFCKTSSSFYHQQC